MSDRTKQMKRTTRIYIVAGVVAVAFFASYGFAAARGTGSTASPGVPVAQAAAGTPGSAACACCGTGATAPAEAQAPKAATVEGDVQRISVDVSKGYYDPSNIELKAGVPAEITFSQSSGCTAQVQSQDLGFVEDLSTGPKTVKLPALQPGTYSFECGMSMVFGSIVVK